MTYLQFHLWFNLPVLCALLWLNRRRLRAVHWKCLTALCAIVLAATTPWDNWAVYRGIWSFDESRVHMLTVPFRGVNWRLPLEEYAFFLVETVQVALVTLLFLPRPTSRGRLPA